MTGIDVIITCMVLSFCAGLACGYLAFAPLKGG